MNVIGHTIINGTPYINGRAATWDADNQHPDIWSSWICPDCNAHLAKINFICLNACHLTLRQNREMMAGLAAAARRVEKRNRPFNVSEWIED